MSNEIQNLTNLGPNLSTWQKKKTYISVPFREVPDEITIKEMRWHEMSDGCELGMVKSMTSDIKTEKRESAP